MAGDGQQLKLLGHLDLSQRLRVGSERMLFLNGMNYIILLVYLITSKGFKFYHF